MEANTVVNIQVQNEPKLLKGCDDATMSMARKSLWKYNREIWCSESVNWMKRNGHGDVISAVYVQRCLLSTQELKWIFTETWDTELRSHLLMSNIWQSSHWKMLLNLGQGPAGPQQMSSLLTLSFHTSCFLLTFLAISARSLLQPPCGLRV